MTLRSSTWPPVAIGLFLARVARAVAVGVLADLGLCRPTPTVADLAFPVVAVRGDGSWAYVVRAAGHLTDPRPAAVGRPTDGTVLIDSGFRLYVERRARPVQGELTMTLRLLLARPGPTTYRFDLRRCWRSGPAAAHARLARCASFGGDPADAVAKRAAVARQTTMAGIVAVLDPVPGGG